MNTINEVLNQHYNTLGDATVEKTAGELSDDAKVAMFAKLAAENNIDLASESDERIEQLFEATFGKQAGEMPPQFAKKDDKKDGDGDDKGKAPPFAKKDEKDKDEEAEKKAAAEAEFNEKRAAEQRFQESDFCGRVMAHAYVNEMKKIAAAVAEKQAAEAATATETTTTDKTAAPTAQPESLRDRLLKIASKEEEKKPEEKKDEKGEKKDEKSLPPWMKDKQASAFESLAVERAMSLLTEYNKTAEQQFDVKIAADRLAAVATLTIPESEKIASAPDAETGLSIRALEYLEAAGYPVNWG